MELSFTGEPIVIADRLVGYGEAGWHVLNAFKNAGLNPKIESKTADVEISFSNPGGHIFFSKNSYKIAYSAWESTDLLPNGKLRMGFADEIWGTSPWTTEVYKNLYPNKKTFTYKHGISTDWVPKKRKFAKKPFTFLHVGEPSGRKDGQIVVDAFVELFGDDPNYRLVLKCSGMNTTRVTHPKYGYIASPQAIYDNIITIESFISREQIIGLHELCDVFVYPSWGEGFGFSPLQALATGMPAISTVGWCDYVNYVTWPVESQYSPNPWPDTHPGMMMKPNKNSLKEQMKLAVETYEDVLDQTFKNAFKIHKEYDWNKISEPAIERVKEIFSELH